MQIGLHHAFQDREPIDLVLSGPNYGRNTTSFFALSSGTLGAAMEGAISGKRSIALSYHFTTPENDPEAIKEASRFSVRLISHLTNDWPAEVDVYNINVPVSRDLRKAKVVYTSIMPSQIGESAFEQIPSECAPAHYDPAREEHRIRLAEELGEPSQRVVQTTPDRRRSYKYHWTPQFDDINVAIAKAGPGAEGWEVIQGSVRYVPVRPCWKEGYRYLLIHHALVSRR